MRIGRRNNTNLEFDYDIDTVNGEEQELEDLEAPVQRPDDAQDKKIESGAEKAKGQYSDTVKMKNVYSLL